MKYTLTTLLAIVLGGTAIGHAATQVDAPSGEVALMTLAAHGVQVYECSDASSAAPAWTFIAPDADLFDANSRRIGKHGAGPTWQHEDGSRFVGAVRARADALVAKMGG